jgi:hypothetical protein
MYNLMLINSSWSATRFVNQEPLHSLEGAFLHLQRWKGDYKKLAYSAKGMPRLNGRSALKLSRFGFGVYPLAYDDELGAKVSLLNCRALDTRKVDKSCRLAVASWRGPAPRDP